MKVNHSILSALNSVLGIDLIAINQYFLHARIIKNWGFLGLAHETFESSINVMKEADHIIERILFLEGLPNLQDLGRLGIGQTVPEILASDLKLEGNLRQKIVQSILVCEKDSDYVSRQLLSGILKSCEKRYDFLETQIELTRKLGLENYLQSMMSEIKN